ncbi:MAG: hypothetical protein ACOXZU_07875 [Bacteroidales bacterium]|jgi:hypothetical protein
MFRYEKDMIPVLRENLAQVYNTEFFLEEFSSGLGIADLVFTTNEINIRDTIVDYESMFYILNYFDIINVKFNSADFVATHNLKKDKFNKVIRFLTDLNFVVSLSGGYFMVKQCFTPCLQTLYSIEAKLEDWKKGYYQALRYRQYSQKCFLAISKEYVHRVDKELLKANNVGLISVSPSSIETIINPLYQEPTNKTAFFFLSECFASKLSQLKYEYQVS